MKTIVQIDSEGRVASVGALNPTVMRSMLMPLIREMPDGNCTNGQCNCSGPSNPIAQCNSNSKP